MIRVLLAGTILVSLATGCGSQPSPRVAVEGTTIAIAIPWEFEIGYGTTFTHVPFGGNPRPAPSEMRAQSTITGPPFHSNSNKKWAYEDLQNGEIIAVLVDPTASTEEAKAVAHLKTRFVAGLNADASADVLSNSPSGSYVRGRQNILFLEIPLKRHDGTTMVPSAASGGEPNTLDFVIELRRFRRTNFGSEQSTFELVPQAIAEARGEPNWVGWCLYSNDLSCGIPITIIDAAGTDNSDGVVGTEEANWTTFEATGVNPGDWSLIHGDANWPRSRPDPHFAVVFDLSGQYGAMEFDVTYPAERIEITGVRLNKGSGWVGLTPSTAAAPACSPTTTHHTTTVHVADPEARFEGVILTYRMKDDVLECDAKPLMLHASAGAPDSEIIVDPASVTVWDVDGNLLPTPGFLLTEQGI